MTERYLIINADDLGISESTNMAINQLFDEKRITSSTLMAPAEFAVDGIKIAAKKNFPIGVHLTINSDWENNRWQSIAPSSRVSSLNDNEGLIYDTKLLAKQAKSSHVTCELEAQINFIKEKGCIPDHADNHCGTLYGTNGRLFFINAFRICRKYNLPFRFPKGKKFLEDQFPKGVPKALSIAHSSIIRIAKLMGVSLIDEMITNPYSINEIENYESLRNYYLKKVSNLGEGITEMFLHPALKDERISNITDEWAKREMEMKFLLQDDLFELIEKEKINLVSWKDAPFS